MNILFFQNCISPHQMPYIRLLPSLPDVNDVLVIVPEVDMASRKAMGWNALNFVNTTGIKFYIAPSNEEIKALYGKYTNTDSWCLFSGINSFTTVTSWFRMSLMHNVKRGIITEPPFIYNHPLWQHAIRFALKDWKYVPYIDKFFVMGNDFLDYYHFWSKRWKVIPFMYCTEWKDRKQISSPYTKSQPLKVLYVGALSHRKNVQILLKASQMLNAEEQKMLEIGIIGDGEMSIQLREMACKQGVYTKVTFYGTQPMEKISTYMEQYDILCLPSLYDGWGAVVNEALTLGLYIICSDHCGAKCLITSNDQKVVRGQIFKSNTASKLMKILKECIEYKDIIRKNIPTRIAWAKKNISGEVVANYFIENLKK